MKTSLTTKLATAAAATGLALAALTGTASPAQAADTTTTFTLTGGGLAVSAPASSALGSVATGTATATAQLGSVTVSDARGALLGAWTSAVTSTDFTTGLATANETIVNDSADYWSGAVASTGTGVFVPGQLLAANKVTLAASRTAASATGVVGNNTATWNPTVIVNVPSAAVAGAYSGTITHSVA
jgi:hypothetical protein